MDDEQEVLDLLNKTAEVHVAACSMCGGSGNQYHVLYGIKMPTPCSACDGSGTQEV